MTIKEYAFRAHAHLKSVGATSLTRSHTHELLAAAAGYSTHAAFQHDAVWCEIEWRLAGRGPDLGRVRDRCVQLGLGLAEAQRTTDGLGTFLVASTFAPVRFDELAAAIEGYEDPDFPSALANFVVGPILEDIRRLGASYPILAEGLEAAAARGVPEAHMAIVHLLANLDREYEDEVEEFAEGIRRSGLPSTPFVSFAEVLNDPERAVHKCRHHVLAAAQAGYVPALEWTAERYGDTRVLSLPEDQVDAGFMVQVAEDAGDDKMLKHWLTVSARQGDVQAMRQLIEEHEENLYQSWVWIFFSRLRGDDLTRDRHVAINEDGTSYDFDVGGPAFVGGVGGVDLPRLPAVSDAQAKQEATALYVRLLSSSEAG